MVNWLLRMVMKLLLALRYRVRVRGLERVARRGRRGILFLPNHPALIDPLIVVTYLHELFAPRALADQDQIDRPIIRRLARRIGIIKLPDVKMYGSSAVSEVEAARRAFISALAAGENMLLYPSGHIYRTRHEDLRGNSAVEEILRAVPDVRIVLIRTRGLWGSRLSLAAGEYPNMGRLLGPALFNLLRSYILLSPRRSVTIELHEPDDLPRQADRHTLNACLERFYNEEAPPALRVSDVFGEAPRCREMPEPQWGRRGGADDVPETTRRIVIDHLRELTGAETIRDEDRLAQDLNLDSLARTELLLWIASEFGHADQDGDAIATVGELMLAARGEAIVTRPTALRAPPAGWFRERGREVAGVPDGETIAEVFLAAARRHPGHVIVADQMRGGLTYRKMITGILALKPAIERLAGEHVGIMLPASVGASVVYFATVFAGKTPLMVNWTTGARNTLHTFELAGVRHVLTSAALVARLESQGTDLSGIKDRLVMLEEVGARLPAWRKLGALLRSYVSWAPLARARVARHAAVLVTSGSENLPKAVPLTHANLLTNIRDTVSIAELRGDDRLIAFLPPFHSFGLTMTVILPPLIGLRTVYHANPTEALMLARLVETYKATLLLGTPTFLSGILRATTGPAALASLRLAVTGAEKCPEHVYDALAERCPRATVLEGYGITECSPIVSVNRPGDARRGTIGRVLPSVEHAIVDADSGLPVKPGERGMLLVRGPSVFSGYLGDDVASPFVEHAGREWYRTGDLVSADEDGVLTFRGRLKRFVKLGGEMVSLPAIENALLPHFASSDDDGPSIAVEATPNEDRPEVVLFATQSADRRTINQHIREAGLSALHNISRVITVPEIPLLGNGKTDYRALRDQLGAGGPLAH